MAFGAATTLLLLCFVAKPSHVRIDVDGLASTYAVLWTVADRREYQGS
jgi:hypothetical protein